MGGCSGKLEKDLEVAEKDLKELEKNLGVLEKDLEVLEKDLGVLEKDLEVLEKDLGVAEKDLGVLQMTPVGQKGQGQLGCASPRVATGAGQ
ncbi:hypothetical protein HGM15179_012456 [Zosterops borbonicus]|uniref:Uncharacterized protein n=1 Tax=Zosterops borbonicus TaxID=364589 RepID=A0A8K1LHZ4_9PASS|nr:hypothetical protein HGM15179_012456 [Zosterops borbonicus]